VLYQRRSRERPSGLAFLMMAMVGIYSFLGPLAGATLGGDLHLAFTFLQISTTVAYLASAIGFLLLRSFMYYIGRELLRWAPREFVHVKAVACTTLAPWLVGTFLLLLLYWPLPRFLVGSTIGGRPSGHLPFGEPRLAIRLDGLWRQYLDSLAPISSLRLPP
jgi:hypothetical protein